MRMQYTHTQKGGHQNPETPTAYQLSSTRRTENARKETKKKEYIHSRRGKENLRSRGEIYKI